MNIEIIISMDEKLEAAVNKIVEAIEKPVNIRVDSELDKQFEALSQPEKLLKEMDEEKEKEKEKEKAPPKKEKPAKAKHTIEQVKQALNSYTKGQKERRANAVELIKKFTDSGKLQDVKPEQYDDLIADLGEL
jgi:uncharacterized caspase-like protein